MARDFNIIVILLLASAQWSYSQVNNCDRVENCFTITQFACSGTMRQICLVRTDLQGCGATSAAMMCNAFAITPTSLTAAEVAESTVCQIVTGGNDAWFAVRDVPMLGFGPGPRSITLSSRSVDCSGYTSACSTSGNLDILLSVPTNVCPPPPPPPPNPTTTQATCRCSQYFNSGSCSVTCGVGVVTQRKFCQGAACNPQGLQTRQVQCVRPTCPGSTPSPIDGNWSVFGPQSACSVTCGTGFATRTRTCSNPAPSPGGQFCPGSNSQTVTCLGRFGACTTRRPPRPCPPFRRLRRICRRNRRRRVCRRCLRRRA